MINLSRNFAKSAALVLAFFIFSGCASTGPEPSDKASQAIEFGSKASTAFERGDYKNALKFYDEALRVSRSTSDTEAVAINLLNRAAVLRAMGNTEAAHGALDELLDKSVTVYSDAVRADAAFLKGLMYLDEEQYQHALKWAGTAAALCGGGGCGADGLRQARISNLMGRAALYGGNPDRALSLAASALSSNKAADGREEKANSIRLTAEAKAAKGDYAEAARLYQEALSMDRELGAGRKVCMDLLGAGNAFLKLKKPSEALKMLEAARAAADSGDDYMALQAAKRLSDEAMNLMLEQSRLKNSELRPAAAALLNGRTALSEGRHSLAVSWGEKALALCSDGKCGVQGRIHNMLAEISLAKGDLDAALENCIRGLEASGREGDRGAAAEAVRIAGRVKELEGEPEAALELFQDALSADKELGLVRETALDCLYAAGVLVKRNLKVEACRYFRDALRAAGEVRDAGLMKEAAAGVEGCPDLSGKN